MSEYLMGDIVQRFEYNVELCNLCGVCVETCEFNAIIIQDNRLYFNPCRCRRCESCEDCPTGAFHIRMITINEAPQSDKKVQERWWELNGNCEVTCDGVCTECGRNKFEPKPYFDALIKKKDQQQTLI